MNTIFNLIMNITHLLRILPVSTKCWLFVFMMVPLCTIGQVNNSGFENWYQSSYNTEEPEGWTTNNVYPFSISVTKSTDCSSGTYAAKIISNGPSFEGRLPGYVETTIYPTEYANELLLHYKCDSIVEPGYGEIIIKLNAGDFYTVGYYSIYSTTNGYQHLRIPLTLDSVPEALYIMIRSRTVDTSGVQYVGFCSITVDDIQLVNATAVKDIVQPSAEVFAIPNEKQIVVNFSPEVGDAAHSLLMVCDLNGSAVFKKEMCNTTNIIALPYLADGLYIVRILNNNFQFAKKIWLH